jgi:hypothetical protein
VRDPDEVVDVIARLRQREVQAIHAAISLRDWSALEAAANELRDKIDRLLIAQGRRP